VIPAHVLKEHDIGRDKYHRIMRSLRNCGYAKLEIERAEDGTIACVRYVITDDPAIPDRRVCEIEDAELEATEPDEPAIPAMQDDESVASLQQPEKPDVVYPRPENPESGLPAPRLSKDLLQKPPLPPRPEPPAQPQAVRSVPAFKALCAKWPGDRIVSPSASERRYLRLSDDRKQAAFDGVERFLAEQRAKGWKICDLQTYLRDRRFEMVKGAPADATIVRAGTPQAYRWLEYYRAIGKPTSFLEERFRAGHPASFPTEWPPPPPASAKAS
jgi:hypothetical protein